jgi:hypothetical protein
MQGDEVQGDAKIQQACVIKAAALTSLESKSEQYFVEDYL